MSQQASTAAQQRSRVPRIAGAAVERARLRVVPRARAARAARVPFVLVVSLVLLAGVVGLLLFNTSMQQASFTTTTLQERAVHLAAREEQLTAELEALREPGNLGRAAQELGMVPATCIKFVEASTGAVTGDPCTPPTGGGVPFGGRDEKPPVPQEVLPPTISVPPTGASSADAAADGDKKKHKPRNDAR